MKKSDKNISKTIKKGRIVQTRDEYFEGQEKYIKQGYENGVGGNYRKGFVVDSNRNNELAIVKGTTKKKNSLPLQDTVSEYKPYIETKDNAGKPIKVGKKFVLQSDKKSLSHRDVIEITKNVQKNKKNREKIRKLKGRK